MIGNLGRLDDLQLDAIREIGNIGAGNAATALSQLMNQQIAMNVPSVHVCYFDEIADLVGGSEQVVVGVFLRMAGDMTGSLFFLLEYESAKMLLESFVEDHADDDFSELQLSALTEMGNILAGSYLSALADFMQKHIQPSVPALSIDMAGAILSAGLLEIGLHGDVALVIETEFRQGNRDIRGHFFMMPDPGAIDTIFSVLGVNSQ